MNFIGSHWYIWSCQAVVVEHFHIDLINSSKLTKLRTSSARSATLKDTSWAWLHLASWNFPDYQFWSKSKTEPKSSRHRTKLGKGGHYPEKVYTGRVDTAHIFWIQDGAECGNITLWSSFGVLSCFWKQGSLYNGESQ